MGKITWSRRIIEDIHAASEYHRAFAPAFAEKLVEEIFAKGTLLESQPLLGRMVPEVGRTDIRELLHKKYRIVYQVRQENILMMVLHPASQPLTPGSLVL